MLRLLLASSFAVAFLAASPAADDKPIEPFNGKNLTGWKLKNEKQSKWVTGIPVVDGKDSDQFAVAGIPNEAKSLVNFTTRGGCDIYTEAKFGDIHLEIEFM